MPLANAGLLGAKYTIASLIVDAPMPGILLKSLSVKEEDQVEMDNNSTSSKP
jgi:hypothetical protein